MRAVGGFDFAILVLTPDDLVERRGAQGQQPRDNVLFERGLFMGRLGRERTFIVHGRGVELNLPSDLAGIQPATFARRGDGNLRAALGPVTTRSSKPGASSIDWLIRVSRRPLGQMKTGFRNEELLGLRDAAQRIAADRNQAAAQFGAKRVGEVRGQQEILLH
jgi:Predicted nucleotide-binding protein containing TIR-like domain